MNTVASPAPTGLGISCRDGNVNSDGVFQLQTGKRRDDIYQLRLFCAADPRDCEAEVVMAKAGGAPGEIEVVRLTGKAVSFDLRLHGV